MCSKVMNEMLVYMQITMVFCCNLIAYYWIGRLFSLVDYNWFLGIKINDSYW